MHVSFWKCGVLIFSSEADTVLTPGSSPIHGYGFLFPFFLYYNKSWDTVS